MAELVWHDVSRVDYKLHRKEGKPDSMRVDYYEGILRVASEWVCFDHSGYAQQKAESWWRRREYTTIPYNTQEALEWANLLNKPVRIATRKNGKYTEVKNYEFDRTQRHQEASRQPSQASQLHQG